MIRFAGLLGTTLALSLAATSLLALEFELPAAARQTAVRDTNPDRYAAPIDVFANGVVPTVLIEGDIRRGAWRIDTPGLTSLQIMRPLRDQLEAAGLRIILDCAAAECGGYDFRFAAETLPGPNMYVNIRAYQVITAVQGRTDAPSEVITILASTSASSAYVQIIQASSQERGAVDVRPVATPSPQGAADLGDLAEQLLGRGHMVLGSLEFGSGSADLGPGPFANLAKLAALLEARPKLRVALVGHTDSVGGLDVNISLSRKRAQSVRRRLVEAYDVDPARMEAEGMGYLAPVASNLDASGRDANRRVEVILLSEN